MVFFYYFFFYFILTLIFIVIMCMTFVTIFSYNIIQAIIGLILVFIKVCMGLEYKVFLVFVLFLGGFFLIFLNYVVVFFLS